MSSEATLSEAVSASAPDGACVWIGNFGTQLFAVARELITLGRRDLHVVIASGGLLLDQLIAADAVAEATFAHCWSSVGPEPAWCFRRAWQRGAPITWHELPIGALCAGLRAGAAGLPFMPVAISPETGYLTEDWGGGTLITVESPFGAATVVRAITPDVAFMHAVMVDPFGNAALGAPAGEALLAAAAARHVVVVCERIASPQQVRAAGITVPGVLVDTVVACPGAAVPDGVPGAYPRDVASYRDYTTAMATAEGARAWLADRRVGA